MMNSSLTSSCTSIRGPPLKKMCDFSLFWSILISLHCFQFIQKSCETVHFSVCSFRKTQGYIKLFLLSLLVVLGRVCYDDTGGRLELELCGCSQYESCEWGRKNQWRWSATYIFLISFLPCPQTLSSRFKPIWNIPYQLDLAQAISSVSHNLSSS